ncbi:hypothetical protein AB0I22_19245 [Streptomyces sp. NPDC050610]|uniref:hypothetical protein n=1 Tax=Streptomyces sp. NPDC050610 TaxID=3157097 RepID=UPI0034453AC0
MGSRLPGGDWGPGLPVEDPSDEDEYNILGMYRSGGVALDVCALVCAGGDWDFAIGGKGHKGGLEELVQAYGIEVAEDGPAQP